MEIPTYFSPEEFKKNYQINYVLFADKMKLPEFLQKCKVNTENYVFFEIYKSDLFRELDAYDKELLDSINKTKEEIELVLKEMFDKKMQPTELVQNGDVPELDFSDNSDKVKLIMLEKLRVIDYIKSIQTKPETISHTSEILSTITGIPSKTLNTYLYPMIRPYRDDQDKNSPYKNPENLEKAERELIKLKIKNIDANR